MIGMIEKYSRYTILIESITSQQPVQSSKVGERRASSPFQNGRTEVLIGEPEGGPRSPRGSTSSALNDGNFLNPLDEREAIYRLVKLFLSIATAYVFTFVQ